MKTRKSMRSNCIIDVSCQVRASRCATLKRHSSDITCDTPKGGTHEICWQLTLCVALLLDVSLSRFGECVATCIHWCCRVNRCPRNSSTLCRAAMDPLIVNIPHMHVSLMWARRLRRGVRTQTLRFSHELLGRMEPLRMVMSPQKSRGKENRVTVEKPRCFVNWLDNFVHERSTAIDYQDLSTGN